MNWVLFSVLLGVLDASVLQQIQQTPTKIYEDQDFQKCQGKGTCNIKARCHFELEDSTNANKSIVGNVFSITNGMSYPITFYWDLFYTDLTADNETETGFVLYGTIYAYPGTVNYFDSGTEDMKAMRLYVPINSNLYGKDMYSIDNPDRTNNKTNYGGVLRTSERSSSFHLHTEHVQTLSLTNNYKQESKCTKDQACKLLLSVCYAAPIETKARCAEYEKGCGHFELNPDPNETIDSLTRDSCFDDCAMEYYGVSVNVDSAVAVGWFLRGGAAKGGNVDGYFNVHFSIAMNVLFYLGTISALTVFYNATTFKRRFKEKGGYNGEGGGGYESKEEEGEEEEEKIRKEVEEITQGWKESQ